MSPELRKNGVLIADLPDVNGVYDTPLGKLEVNLDGVDADSEKQQVVLKGESLGVRVIDLSPVGIGSQQIAGGDLLEVALKQRPIRGLQSLGLKEVQSRGITGSGRTRYIREPIKWKNPAWVRKVR